jgi:hypothetical protein
MAEQVKVSWKLGNLEMQYEGNEEFLKSGFPQLFRELLEIYGAGSKNGGLQQPEIPPITDKPIIETPSNNNQVLDVNTIAKKLQLEGRKNLVMAACLYLVLVEGKEVFSRDEIIVAMKAATQFYSENSLKSLSQYITSLTTQGYLLERAQDVYAIDGGKLKELQAMLAGDKAREENPPVQSGSKTAAKAERKSVKKLLKVETEKFDTDKTDDTPSLNEFFSQRIPSNARQKDRVVLIAYYIQHIKNLPSFSEGNIDYGYKILGITDRPANIYQMLIDNKNAFGWFEKTSDGKSWTLMRPGEIYVEKFPVQPDK